MCGFSVKWRAGVPCSSYSHFDGQFAQPNVMASRYGTLSEFSKAWLATLDAVPTNQPPGDTQRSLAERAKSLIARSPLVWFFVLAFVFSWVVTVPMVLLQGTPQWTMLATFAPTLAALVVSRIATGRFRFWTFPVDWTRLVCGCAAGAALVVTAYIVLPGIFTADPRKLNWNILASLHVFNYST